jgi:hypothetical protein
MVALLVGLASYASVLKADDPKPLTKDTTSKAGDEAVLFDTPPAVETASLYTQTLQEAPANVTVITRQADSQLRPEDARRSAGKRPRLLYEP